MFMVLEPYAVTWTTDDDSTQTVAELTHTLTVHGTQDLSKLLTILASNPFRSLIVEPVSLDQEVSNG